MSSERRLHPLSLLFTLGSQLRQMVVPLVLAFFADQARDEGPLLTLVLLVPSIIVAIGQYVVFRYRYDEKELVVHSGIFVRKERHIPYDRIQNIDAVQTVAHRMLGVYTVHVQTGSGSEPEATLSVLPIDGLEEMRAKVFSEGVHARPQPVSHEPNDAAAAPARVSRRETLLHLSPRELMLSGLLENRGMVLILAVLGFAMQFAPRLSGAVTRVVSERLPTVARFVEAVIRSAEQGSIPIHQLLVIVVFALVFVVFVRILSALWALIRLFDFRLGQDGEDLRIEYGLLTRVAATIPLRRIQSVIVHESLLHRALGRVAVGVTTAGGKSGQASADREWLAPLLRKEALGNLLERVQPGLDLDVEWQPPHPRAFLRAARVSGTIALFIALVLYPWIGWWSAALFVVLLIRALYGSHLLVANLGWGVTSNAVVFKGGRLDRYMAASRFSRIQSVELGESPFDRRSGMASLSVDTAGASGPHLQIRYIPMDDAKKLHALLARKSAETAFVW
jgi:putative membrane protein